jgi:hypothetical protein
MKISVIHPSRGRPEQAYKTVFNWVGKCDKENFEYILSLDEDMYEFMKYNPRFGYLGFPKVIYSPNKSAIEAINNAAKIAIGDLIIVISDDTDCPEHWDTSLLQQIEYTEDQQYAPLKDFCIKTDDGLQPTLITMPIMDRVYYERYGYVYHPDYKHMFADQELTAVAMMTGKYIKLDLKFPHNHYSTGKTPKDAINSKNDATWSQGERLFNERLKTNFGITHPVMEYNQIVWR